MDRGEAIRLSLEELDENGIDVVNDLESLDAYVCSLVFRLLQSDNEDVLVTIRKVTDTIIEKYFDILAHQSILPDYDTTLFGGNILLSDEILLEQQSLTEVALKELLNQINIFLIVENNTIFKEYLIVFQRANNLSIDQMSQKLNVSHNTYKRWLGGFSTPREDNCKQDIFRQLQEYPSNWFV